MTWVVVLLTDGAPRVLCRSIKAYKSVPRTALYRKESMFPVMVSYLDFMQKAPLNYKKAATGLASFISTPRAGSVPVIGPESVRALQLVPALVAEDDLARLARTFHCPPQLPLKMSKIMRSFKTRASGALSQL